MKKIILLLFIITFCRCEQKFELPKNSKVIAKYIVFDENISPYLDVCKDKDDTIADFKTRGLDCMFRLDKDIFEIEYVITLSEKGRIKNIGSYNVTDNIDYNRFGIEKDTTNSDKLAEKKFFIGFSNSKKEIIDGVDTLKIQQIFPEERVIFVEDKNVKKGRRILYEYK